MYRLIVILTIILLAACAENPLGLTEGMWVRNKLDGQKYYITHLSREQNAEHGGLVRVKNELGVEVEKDFAIHDFELWIERKEIPDGAAESVVRKIEDLQKELDLLRVDLEIIKKIVQEKNGERHWNPETQKYE